MAETNGTAAFDVVETRAMLRRIADQAADREIDHAFAIAQLAEIVESLLPRGRETHAAFSFSRCSCGWEVDGFTAPELTQWKLDMHIAAENSDGAVSA